MPGDNAEILRNCLIFKALVPEDRRLLAARAHARTYQSGETIFRFGSPGESLVAVLSGRVRISRPAPRGNEVILGEFHAGDLLGEIAVLDGGARSATAVAVLRTEALILDRSEVLRFLRDHANTCLLLLELLCKKVRESDERMSDIGFAGVAARLAKALLFYHRADPRGKGRIDLTQQELGDVIGARRESVSRQVNEWKERGIVNDAKGWTTILDAEALTAIAELG